jgi:hypothetical protein
MNILKLFLLSFIVIWIQPVSAQINISKLSADIGLKQNIPSSKINESNKYFIYPEIQIGGKFIEKYLEWDVGWSYQDDGQNEPLPVADYITYSYNSHSVGAHISFYPAYLSETFSIPIHLISGFSYHFVSKQYVGGYDFTGSSGADDSYGISTVDLGLGLNHNLMNNFRVRLDGMVYFPLPGDENSDIKNNSSSIQLGFDYLIN